MADNWVTMNTRSNLKPAAVFFIFIALYMTLRAAVYAYFSELQDYDEWVFRDFVMNGPRLLVGSLAIFYGVKEFGKSELGLRGSRFALPCILLLLLLSFSALDGIGKSKYELSVSNLLILFGSSFVVGFFEEALFRGLGLSSLRMVAGDWGAVLVSTVCFTVFHYGAQPISSWPMIFFVGMLYGLLRIEGVSLYWLIVLHGITDASWFVLNGTDDSIEGTLVISILTGILSVGYLVTRSRLRSIDWLRA